MKMNKLMIWIILSILMISMAFAITITRTAPSSASPSSTFTVTYTAVGDNTKWAVPIEDTITGGCTPTSTKIVIMHDIGQPTTKTEQYTFTTPSSGTCTFTGFWTDSNDVKQNFPTANVALSGSGCTGSATQSCVINVGLTECAGTQTRTCNSGIWSSWGTCVKTDANCGTTTCTNDCPTDGKKECVSTTSYKSCGNFDADSCFEWSTTSNCPSGQTCDSGICSTQTCTVTDNKASTKCYLDDIYYYDNCANRKDVKEDCTNGCDGDTKCKAATNTTSGFDFSSCISGKDTGDLENLDFGVALFNFDCFRIIHTLLIFGGLMLFSFIK